VLLSSVLALASRVDLGRPLRQAPARDVFWVRG